MMQSLSSFPFYIIAGSTKHPYFSQWNVVDSCNTQRRHQSLFGWDSKRKTDPPGMRSHMGEKLGSAFEA